MRPIDADALTQTLIKRHERFMELTGEDNEVINAMYQYAIKVINDAPDIDCEQKKDGEWISRIDGNTWMLECSVCGHRVKEGKYRMAIGSRATKCPYCGAELGLGGHLHDDM